MHAAAQHERPLRDNPGMLNNINVYRKPGNQKQS